ncbi:MAG: glycosyltransferase family 25 protein [Pseudomonadota bacterium]
MKADAYVLHLERAVARRDNAQSLVWACEDAGLGSELWPAVDGDAVPQAELDRVVGADLMDPPYPFALRPGEIGCFLSHRQIWAEMQVRDAPAALIIEDDARIAPAPFLVALRMALHQIEKLGYIQLQTRGPRGPSRLVDSSGASRLIVPQLGGLRTTAQVVSRAAADHLLRHSGSFDRPVDTFVQAHWYTGMRPAMIFPSGVFEIGAELAGSTIQKGTAPVLSKLKREVSRTWFRAGVARLSKRSTAPAGGGLDEQ